jgi:hypothetical protein
MMMKSSKQSTQVLFILICLLLVNLACGTSTSDGGLNVATQVAMTLEAINGEQPGVTAAPACTSVAFNGITLCYDPALAQGTTTSVIPASVSADDPWFSAPQIDQIDFTNYITGKRFHAPHVMVFSVADYRSVNDNANETITTLQQYLSNKPNIPAGPIPFLPAWNAAQLFNVLPAFVNFQNGQGIRYLAEYGQYTAPVNSMDLFYTFQGITNDGNYYVSIIMPVGHPSLAADANIDASLQQQLIDNYQKYLADVLPTLSAQPMDSFTPNLSLLDAMVQSLQVH